MSALGESVGKTYLGDGVYVSHDGYQFWLRTDLGGEATNEIALEPAVWRALVAYVERIAGKATVAK